MPETDLEKEFAEAFDKYADAIYRHCFFRVHSKQAAEDLTQETFMKTWDYIRNGKEIENTRAFLYKVATNLIIDRSRQSKEKLSLDELKQSGFEPELTEQEHIENYIDGKQAVKLINDLDDIYKEAVFMRYVDGLSPQEIAEIIGETPNVVSVRIHRGLERLKEMMQDEKDE